jgi:hypothetical protein
MPGIHTQWLQYKHLQQAFTSLKSDEVLELGTHTYTRNHHLYGPHKKYLVGKQFATEADKKQAVTSCLHTSYADFLHSSTKAMVPQWDR